MNSENMSTSYTPSYQAHRLPESLARKIELWRSLSREEKIEAIREVLEYFKRKAKENPMLAWMQFTNWLRMEDGCVMFPWMWKEEFRDVMTDIAYYYIVIVERMMGEQ